MRECFGASQMVLSLFTRPLTQLAFAVFALDDYYAVSKAMGYSLMLMEITIRGENAKKHL